jgi:DNA-binding GntR family transcriptional regulator
MDLETTPLKRGVALSEQIYQVVRGLIVSGRMRPGEAVIEAALAARLGVSRTPVREALGRLASEGLLVATRRGYRVPQFSAQDMINLSEIRLLLEPQAAMQAAANTTDVGLDEMRKAISEEVAAHANEDVNEFLTAHMHFRSAWMQRVTNPLLLETLAKTMHSLHLIRRWTMSDPVIRGVLIDAHRALLKAIERRDPAKARAAQSQSIRIFRTHLVKRLSQDNAAV